MDLVTRHAWNRRLIPDSRHQFPRPTPIERFHQIANTARKMRAMAPQAILDEHLLTILFGIQKDLCISNAVRTRFPICKLLAVT